jgi:lipopolysaccharide transport system ATP-binding protein
MATVSALCNRAVMLREGRLVIDAPVEEVVQHYMADMSERAKIPAAERTDRGGTGEVVTTGIELLGRDDRPLVEASSGRFLKLRHHFRCRDATKFPNCTVVLVLRYNDHVVCVLSTSLVRRKPVTLSGEGFIDFTIDQLPLAGGTYTIGALIKLEDRDADVLYGAIEMEVIDGDFFGTGQVRPLPGWSDSGVLVPHACEVHLTEAPRRALAGAGTCEPV